MEDRVALHYQYLTAVQSSDVGICLIIVKGEVPEEYDCSDDGIDLSAGLEKERLDCVTCRNIKIRFT